VKEFLKNITNRDRIGKSITDTWMLLFFGMGWICAGMIFFAVAVQWILILLLPTKWPYAMELFILVWCLFGIWHFFVRKSSQ
jgi:hypothetical protein